MRECIILYYTYLAEPPPAMGDPNSPAMDEY